jgi:peroxiredoxin
MKTSTTIMQYASALLASALLPAAAARETGASQAPVSPAARIEKLPQLIREAQKGVFFLRVLDEKKRVISSGTGFLVNDKGALITSLHVIRPSSLQQPAAAEAIGASGKTFKVKGVTGDDESLDLALLELEEVPADAVPVALAGDEPPEQGAYVLVVGHPQGLRFVCTDGIVSAVNKTSELPEMFREGASVLAGPDVLWLQTSASVPMGNSGGPMLDAGGRAIGVMQWMARGAGMNFALHISAVKGLLAKPPVKAIDVAEFARPEIELQHLQRKFQADYQTFFNSQLAGRRLSENQPGSAPAPAAEHPAKKYLPAMVELAAANRGRGVELRALSTVMMVACSRDCPPEVGPEAKRAADLMLADFPDDRRILPILRCRNAPTLPEARNFLRQLAEQSTDGEIRSLAWFSLAEALEEDGPPAREEALKLANAAAAADPEIMLGQSSLADLAKELSEKLSHSAAGCPAPELTGKDRNDKDVKLADFRGRHVVVVFWSGGSSFFGDVPQYLDELVKTYGNCPLEIIGVRTNDSGSSVSSFPENKKPDTGWKALRDSEDGSLAKTWHVSKFPTVFLVDPAGMIRFRHTDRPYSFMMMAGGNSSMMSSFNSYYSEGSWKPKLTKELDAIPAIAEGKNKLQRLLTSGPWLALNDWQGQGERTVFLRENGKTSVNWITKWAPKPPNILHVDVKGAGCVELEVDLKTGEAKVISPPSFVQRTLKLRDSGPRPDVDAAQSAKVRECLLKESWQWFASGGIDKAEQPYMKFRCMPDGTTTSDLIPAWEMLPSAQVQVYLYDGRSWVFDLDPEAKSARSNLKDGQIKDNKLFTATGGEVPMD